MKRLFKGLIPLFLILGILASVAWYLLVYDQEFTRDMLISQARQFDARGNVDFAATLYDLAYDYTGKDEDVAIELANQYRNDGNYTKAEYILTHAIADRGTPELYMALSRIFVEQDKLLDAVALLDQIQDSTVKAQISLLRPEAPKPSEDPGYYTRYLTVELASDGVIYYTVDGDYPSLGDEPYQEGIPVSGGETLITALSVSEDGLVSKLSMLKYTVGGVIEEASFTDPVFEETIRQMLGVDSGAKIMTDTLWNITELDMPQGIQRYEDLKLLPYLQKLNISGFRYENMEFLTTLTELQELHMDSCRFPVEDIATIASLPKLEKLTLSNCALSTISGLENAVNLTYLDLGSNTLRNLEPLSGLTMLRDVNLGHNAVTDLTMLSGLTELTTLDISYNSVHTLSPLAQCSKLSWLNAGNNMISTLEGIESFTALTHLDLDHNKLSDVYQLSNCTQLTELNLSNNILKEIESLSALTELTKLNISYNQIYLLPTWPEGSKLSILDGSYNLIESVYPLRNLEELTYLYLDYNKLYSVDAIAGCYRLVMVNVYGNEITDVDKLKEHNIIVNYDPT